MKINRLHMAVKHGGIAPYAEPVCGPVERQPHLRTPLLRTYPCTELLVEYLGTAARYGLHTGLPQQPQSLVVSHTRLLYHIGEFYRRERLHAPGFLLEPLP